MAPHPFFSDADILAARGHKNPVRADQPYAMLVEPEVTAGGTVEDVATIFLTNRECPFRCLMCDLWKNTTDQRVPPGAIPGQIDFALSRLPAARHIKLYNSGNFFDAQAVPPEDLADIAARVRHFDTVIVENHPALCGRRCLEFRDLVETQLEVAIGLETIHPDVLPRLNKQMTAEDFRRAVEFLCGAGIRVRTFILLRPPLLSEAEGVEWAIRSTEFAFDCGVSCCAIIPTRSGNGIMQQLQQAGQFQPPVLASLEAVHDHGLALRRERVLVDLWDVESLIDCETCGPARVDRLRSMNLQQTVLPRVSCDCRASS